MATTSDLTSIFREAFGTQRTPLFALFRRLRDAGELPAGHIGRGGAAEVEPEHAAEKTKG